MCIRDRYVCVYIYMYVCMLSWVISIGLLGCYPYTSLFYMYISTPMNKKISFWGFYSSTWYQSKRNPNPTIHHPKSQNSSFKSPLHPKFLFQITSPSVAIPPSHPKGAADPSELKISLPNHPSICCHPSKSLSEVPQNPPSAAGPSKLSHRCCRPLQLLPKVTPAILHHIKGCRHHPSSSEISSSATTTQKLDFYIWSGYLDAL